MRITKRVVNSRKYHTTGYVIDGHKKVTTDQAVNLVYSQKLTGYYVGINYNTGKEYVASMPNRRQNTLKRLPVVVKA